MKKEKTDRRAETHEPPERFETIRHYIAALLEEGTYTSKGLSGIIKIPERDICDHLEHLRQSLGKGGRRLTVICASCRHCGFVFRKRDRLTKPGKCPSCRSIHIQPPLFHIEPYTGTRGKEEGRFQDIAAPSSARSCLSPCTRLRGDGQTRLPVCG